MPETRGWTIKEWQQAYQQSRSPEQLLHELVTSLPSKDSAWISVITPDQLAENLKELAHRLDCAEGDKSRLPLYGVPFAVKDNIDVAGYATTAACEAFAYTPEKDAAVVARLKAAGAIVIGKTNLDQFATGLVGTRSPFGAVPNSFNPDYISGGSSSGSASVVARGLVPLALGTDTAGSGRVPAGLNNLIGLKPTKGAISIEGVVPACRTLDCVSIFAHTLEDSRTVLDLTAIPEPADPFSRTHPPAFSMDAPAIRRPGVIRRLGVPADPQWYGDQHNEAAWQVTLEQWKGLGYTLMPIDFTPLFELAALLYEGPWVAERHAAVDDFMAKHADSMNPVVRSILDKADQYSATETFKALYRKEELVRAIDQLLAETDALLVPTAPVTPTQAEVDSDPVGVNSLLGTYTNFVNLADMSALAIPAGFRTDGLPFGLTLISGAWRDADLQQIAGLWMNAYPTPLGATERDRPAEAPFVASDANDMIAVAVVGAHLSGMPLNIQLIERNAERLEETTTASTYRLYALPNTTPPKPGLRRVDPADGAAITVEVWQMPASAFGSFVDLVPPPLGIGNVELSDGRWVNGFICEGYALEGARDVTAFGGWRAYIEALKTERA